MKILFYDTTAQVSYDLDSLSKFNAGIGGTEGTVIRVAERLAEQHEVVVAEKFLVTPSAKTKVKYVPQDFLQNYFGSFDVVVCIRRIDHFISLYQRFYPKTKFIVLCENFDEEFEKTVGFLVQSNGTMVEVSQHLHDYNEKIRKEKDLPIYNYSIIANPIDDNLTANDTKRDPNKLVFFSSPHKGLQDTIQCFKFVIHPVLPNFHLYYANPGYMLWQLPEEAFIHNLGIVNHSEVIQHAREAFCVLYLNRVFPETFGLVYAEANAVGTPVITFDIGAAREILDLNNPLLNLTASPIEALAMLLTWIKSPPQVNCTSEYRLTQVVEKWKSLLE